MEYQIKVGSIRLSPPQDLLIAAACQYYDISKSGLIAKSDSREHARRKGIVFFLLNSECQLTNYDIAKMCNTTRQNVAYAIDKTEAAINIYLRSICDYRNIKAVFIDLQEKQDKWLERVLP